MNVEFTAVPGSRAIFVVDAGEADSDAMVLSLLNAANNKVPFEVWNAEYLTIHNIYRLRNALEMIHEDRRPPVLRVLFGSEREIVPSTWEYIRGVFSGL